ncbi:MAG: hypothetical protein ACYC5Y_07195 [Symbiobacteriia bacterium]
MARRVSIIGLGVLTALALCLIGNFLMYGKVDPFAPPAYIYVFGRHYDASLRTVTAESREYLRRLPISIHTFLGKQLYSQSPTRQFVPTVIYLHLRGDTFLPYGLSGGP